MEIASKLEQARSSGFQPFGAEAHGFLLVPCLTEEVVAAFEGHYGFMLPEGYRNFLIDIGNGKAGPGYGLFSLEEAIRETQMDGLSPQEFFVHPPHDGMDDDKPVCGILPLCHEGCGYYHVLVVVGPERGQMLLDGRVSDGGLHPLGCDFLGWYERWLDEVLAGNDGAWWLEESDA